MMQPILSARGLVHNFGEGPSAVQVLKNIDIDILPGEVLLLVGPSGSGKTTLVHILGHLLRPTAGKITICGKSTETLDEDRLAELRLQHFGFIFQAHNLFPMLTATENVMVALDLMGVEKDVARVRAHELLGSVGLGHRIDAFPSELSIGQKQRVAIARALAADPEILIADEPTAALDSENGLKAMELLQALARNSRRAVVIVTHDFRIFQFANRVLHLEDGRIVDKPPESSHSFGAGSAS
ncbi:putative ABC transport system ATP-binding protein [Methylosinus sp. sav-2]|jgi:putative ABC transport system ATP-binding protein|uniref:ABC transporter ATP-binding protein n=1 Tax=unclassified Methylosinus TaxID=2624500 RepID=UPI0004652909|nr:MULTISPECIES: ABC transporter ATP-binding protein [unclassified Methylosinus]TDX62558.1 putative ABC transport system ATP-binding protein [Methylosinus sp. sav-2]